MDATTMDRVDNDTIPDNQPIPAKPNQLTSAGERLRSFIERIERLEEEKKAIADDIKEVRAEAKSQGFDVKTITKILALRKKDPDDRAEEDTLLDTYMTALGMR